MTQIPRMPFISSDGMKNPLATPMFIYGKYANSKTIEEIETGNVYGVRFFCVYYLFDSENRGWTLRDMSPLPWNTLEECIMQNSLLWPHFCVHAKLTDNGDIPVFLGKKEINSSERFTIIGYTSSGYSNLDI